MFAPVLEAMHVVKNLRYLIIAIPLVIVGKEEVTTHTIGREGRAATTPSIYTDDDAII